jgi:alpha-D-ribose 1-methylphosphonate 5-triphosphate synthase subunit PhnL
MTKTGDIMLRTAGLEKTFLLHTQGGVRLEVLRGVDVTVHAGECIALNGPSGSGKSSLMRCLYGNYRADAGHIFVRHDGGEVDIATAEPREILAVRRTTMGYVSQFLRAVPRVPALDIVAEPLRAAGVDAGEARSRAGEMLGRLNIPERLWPLAPATFSGGEQQRVNVARGLMADFPILLLDEPTSALDERNRKVVVQMIREKAAAGCAVIGIFHDIEVRDAVSDRLFEMQSGKAAA